MDLAKQSLDVGLYVTNAEASRAFYERDLGLPYEELLPVGGGVRQHRLGLRGSVLKLNESRNDVVSAPTGYRRLLIAGDDGARDATDPDGVAVSMDDRVTHIGIKVASADPDAHARFYVDGLGADSLGDHTFRIGTTLLFVTREPAVERSGPLSAAGFRYLTIQVRDVQSEHERLVGMGFEQAMPPRKLGDVAAISFVRDPGGNWLEISQRASLTGPLPESV
jgi:catechol 2,3-dioxygenase-like lactoylglutathione lyase family enzyme